MAARSFLYGGDSSGGGSVLLTNKMVHCSSSGTPADPLFVPRSSAFQGCRSMLSFKDLGKGSGGQFWQNEENGEDEYDDYFHQPEKKRRLTVDQVGFLEKSFESDNKLEPERKAQIAKEVGLQPRQVAIWFQNRRARWKNKQLEKDYDDLQESYNKLKAKYENLVKEKEKLKFEVDKLMLQEKGTSDSSSTKTQHVLIDNHTSLIDSSYVFEQEQSDGSLDEENKMLMPCLSSNGDYMDPYLGLPGVDQAFGFWSYQ